MAPSLEERARREEEAAKEELARWQVPGQAEAPRRRLGLFRSGKPARQEPEQDTGQPRQEPAQSPQGTGPGTDRRQSTAPAPATTGVGRRSRGPTQPWGACRREPA
ncbi:hypothetical protein ACFQ0B_18330 [Nonomuraea thailandensis]